MLSEPSPSVVSQLSLKGKVAIVTGGARGLGYEMMLALAETGASIACIDLHLEQCEKATNKIQSLCDVQVSSWSCDVVDCGAVTETFKKIVQHHGKIDILVTAAGINKVCRAIDYTPEDLSNIFQVNVFGTFYCMQQAAKLMMNTGGSIITIASMSAHIVNRPHTHAPYNATKSAVVQLTKSVACEWTPYHIRVNAISPGYFDTDMNRILLSEQTQDLRKIWEQQTPMGRLGTPHELKGIVVFLASDVASFVTGSEFIVDGGYTAW